MQINSIKVNLKKEKELFRNIDTICSLFLPNAKKFIKSGISIESGLNPHWEEIPSIKMENEESILLSIKSHCDYGEENLLGENIFNLSNFDNRNNSVKIPLFDNGENIGNAIIDAEIIK